MKNSWSSVGSSPNAVVGSMAQPRLMTAQAMYAHAAGGIAANVMIVAEARLQDAITGPSRATVTSVSGLFSEVFALAVFGTLALGSAWFAVSTMVVALSAPILLIAMLVPRWLPRSGFGREAEHDTAVRTNSQGIAARVS